MVLPTVRALAPRLAGRSLFYLSSQGTGDGLWRFEDGKAIEILKGSDEALFEPPAVSPDGRQLAVILRRDGKLRLHVLSADGGDLQSLAEPIDIRGSGCCSPHLSGSLRWHRPSWTWAVQDSFGGRRACPTDHRHCPRSGAVAVRRPDCVHRRQRQRRCAPVSGSSRRYECRIACHPASGWRAALSIRSKRPGARGTRKDRFRRRTSGCSTWPRKVSTTESLEQRCCHAVLRCDRRREADRVR